MEYFSVRVQRLAVKKQCLPDLQIKLCSGWKSSLILKMDFSLLKFVFFP